MSKIQNLLSGWNVSGKKLLSTDTRENRYKPVDVESAATRAKAVTNESAPNNNGWAIPLHSPNEPRISDEYVVWRPDSRTIGWKDAGFGINGTTRFADVEDIENTIIGHRMRFWSPEAISPEDVDFDLPPDQIPPLERGTSESKEEFFKDLESFVREERDTAKESNWEKYTDLGFSNAVKRNYASGPFVPLGRGVGKFEAEGFKYQLAEEDGGDDVDLRDEHSLFRNSLVIVDADVESDSFPFPAELVGVYDQNVVLQPDWNEIENQNVVEKQLTDSGPDIWLSPLLNPVPYNRQLKAIKQVRSDKSKSDLITGNRNLKFTTNEYALPDPEIELNEYQRQAVVWSDSAHDLVCIHGPPGTGKTRTLTAYVQHAVSKGKSVLVTAHSNQAVDNLLVGDSSPGNPEKDTLHELAQNQESEITIARVGSNTRNTVVQKNYLKNSHERADIVAATTSGASQFDQNKFDVAVVDEATQASRPSTAIVLNCAQKLILAGDHKQLPPFSADETMQEEDLHISLFEYLLEQYGDEPTVLLQTQYRMNHQIAEFPNQAFYDGQLKTNDRNYDWDISGLKPLIGIDILGEEEQESHGKSKYNLAEAEAAAKQVKLLVKNDIDPSDIGVITAYSGQKSKIKSALHQIGITHPRKVAVDTVDSFQGGEREAIIISFVRSNPDGYSGFLEFPDVGPRRLNVALTRARKRLVLIGNWETLGTVAPHRDSQNSCADLYDSLANHIRERDLMLSGGTS